MEPLTHDAFRRVTGSYGWTLRACRAAAAAGLRLQVNTTVSRDTVRELPGIARLVRAAAVPPGRGRWPGGGVRVPPRRRATERISAPRRREHPRGASHRRVRPFTPLASLRDPGRLGGRCGQCEFVAVCGGSRSQAYGRSGDPLGEDGSCPYEPAMS